MTRRPAISPWMLALALAAACKARPHDEPSPATAAAPTDASAPDANLDGCRAAAARVPHLPATERAQALLDACQPCGDWTPLLAWNTPAADGGPTRAAIERAMLACKAYCEPNAKQRFLGTLDAARGQSTRTPWRFLGEICKAEVSAVPDARFMGAPYFALDRIARAIGDRDPGVLAAIDVPLPAVSVTGVGIDLPSVPGRAAAASDAGPIALTVDASQILLGTLPVAKLSPTGLQVSGDYPGAPIEPRALAAALADHVTAEHPAALLAPHALAATRVVAAVAAAAGHPVRLAVAAPSPRSWSVAAALPIALAAPSAKSTGATIIVLLGAPAVPTAARALDSFLASRTRVPAGAPITVEIRVFPAAKVDDLATLLAGLAAQAVPSVVLVAGKPSGAKP